MIKIAASMMCADQLTLKNELDRLAAAKVDLLHCDVMDGLYVPNLAMGPDVLEAIRQYTTIPLDIHLMIIHPERYIDRFTAIQPEYISVHADATEHLYRAVAMIKDKGVKAAVALSPSTPLPVIETVLPELDMVLVMTVDPGFAGQKFIPGALKKIKELKQICMVKKPDILIEIDGNINSCTIPPAIEAGADVLVAGTASVFKGPTADYTQLVQEMRNAAQ